MSKTQTSLYNWNYIDEKNRSPVWYMVALSIAIGFVIWGFFTKQYGMSIVIMIITGLFFFIENNSDNEVRIDITELGVKVQEQFYDYARISAYSIVYHGDQAIYLRLYLKKRGITTANLRIDNEIANHIQSFLPHYVEENEKQEITLLERIIHILKI